MDAHVQVEVRLAPGNVVVLTVKYAQPLLFERGRAKRLAEEFVNRYQDALRAFNLPKAPCVVVIEPDTAASGLSRGLLALYKEVVEARGSKFAVADYPTKYLDDLTVTGIADLPGFELTDTEQEALRIVQ